MTASLRRTGTPSPAQSGAIHPGVSPRSTGAAWRMPRRALSAVSAQPPPLPGWPRTGHEAARGLAANTSVTSIDLTGNTLGVVAGTALAEALKVNITLTFIDFYGYNDLPDATKQ